jgi:hypothetical protein
MGRNYSLILRSGLLAVSRRMETEAVLAAILRDAAQDARLLRMRDSYHTA